MSASRAARSRPRARGELGRLERPALMGVLVREVINFSSFWKSSAFSSTVEPTIYLLAFGFGFGSLVSTVGGYDYVEFVGTGTVATAVLFASVFSAMFGSFVKYQFQRTYDAILAAPVDTEELVTAEALWIAARAGIFGSRRCSSRWCSGWIRAGACCSCRSSAPSPATAGLLRDLHRGEAQLDRPLLLRHEHGPHADVPGRRHVLPARPACRSGRRCSASSTRCYHCVQLVRHAAFGFDGWIDLYHVGALVVFALVTWRLAIHYMTKKLVD